MDDHPTPPPDPGSTSFLMGLREHRVYRVGLAYGVAAWIVLQVAAIVLPGFGAPPWVLRALMILLALGFGGAMLAGWSTDRRASGLPFLPRATRARVLWGLAALLPAVAVTGFFLMRPLPRPVLAATVPTAPAPVPMPAAPEKSIAVLPFDTFTKDDDTAAIADGVQDEVLTDLAKVADLKVISRSSVMQYRQASRRNLPEIGRALGVAYVVEGSVQHAKNQVRITAQLIDARTDVHHWAESYDRDLSNVLGVQSEIAGAIAGQLQAVISPQEHVAMAEAPTRDLKAYELYLRAVGQWNSLDEASADINASAAALLTEATARDPHFSRAYALLTEVQAQHYRYFLTTPEQDAIVRGLAATVARLRPGSGEASAAQGEYEYWVRRDFARARDEFAAAVRLSPNDSTAFYYLALTDRRQGRWDDALAHVSRAVELDPEDVGSVKMRMEVYDALRRYPEAVAVIDRWLAAHPQAFWAYPDKARTLLAWKASPDAALVELARLPPGYDPNGLVTSLRVACECCARDLNGAARTLAACPLAELNDPFYDDVSAIPRASLEGAVARYRGDGAAAAVSFAAARATLAERVRTRPADAGLLLYLATADAALGHREQALEEGRRGAAMQPPARDATDGPGLSLLLARVLAWTGERDEAIRTLQTLAASPNGPDYGSLHLHPDWDPLRGDPRFEALVASLAPK